MIWTTLEFVWEGMQSDEAHIMFRSFDKAYSGLKDKETNYPSQETSFHFLLMEINAKSCKAKTL